MPQRFYVASLQTLDHTDLAYIGCAAGDDPRASPASAWYITNNPDEAFPFVSLDLARGFTDRLEEGEAYGLKNDGRRWHVVERL